MREGSPSRVPPLNSSPGGGGEGQEALIHPRRRPGEGDVTPTVVLTFTQPDYRLLCRLAEAHSRPRHLWDCALRQGSWAGTPLTIAAPALGAPYAAMVMEKLIALGARRLLALGWCGSLDSGAEIGHLILPSGAVSGDGTSPHYAPDHDIIAPDYGLYTRLETRLKGAAVPWHAGLVWTTDAFYRETPALVRRGQERGALGIDLELAALLAVGQFRRVRVAALLIVSDELFTFSWRPAGSAPGFRQAREVAARVVLETAAEDDLA